MQIDYHHGTTYVIARYAGFAHAKAEIIAHSAQYVDDATNDGVLYFDNQAMYARIASAHKMLDYRNMNALANHRAWIPFHFLPGNEGKPAGANPNADFRHKIICRPNSPIAQDMVAAAIACKDKPNGLHRLGVTMHVYADTWAHQGFAGINDKINEVKDVADEDQNPDPGFAARIGDFFGDVWDSAQSSLVGDALPLGHGAALSYPDRPFLKWHYTNGEGQHIERNNPKDFLEASEHLCRAMQRFQLGDPKAEVSGLSEEQKTTLDQMFRSLTDDDGEERHKAWLAAIKQGQLGFPAVDLHYKAKGAGSWKHQAIGDTRSKQKKSQRFPYHPSFLDSDWKHFHDALIAHRHTVIYDILPRYGICAA